MQYFNTTSMNEEFKHNDLVRLSEELKLSETNNKFHSLAHGSKIIRGFMISHVITTLAIVSIFIFII
jgi:hypothetical protein